MLPPPHRPMTSLTSFRLPPTRFTSSALHVNDYTTTQLSYLRSTPTKYIFATLPPSTPAPSTPIAQLFPPLPPPTLHPVPPALPSLLTSLRLHPNLLAFSIYPTTPATLPLNALLWRSVHAGFYSPPHGDPLLAAHVFALGLSPELHAFLLSVSLEETHRAIIDFLVLLHHQLEADADHAGLAKLQTDLVPDVWHQLTRNIGVFPNGEPTEPRRAKVLENLVQISFMTPWRVDVSAAYLTAEDVTGLVGLLPTRRPGQPVAPCRYILAPEVDSRNCPEHAEGRLLLKIFQDWRVFAAVLHDAMGLPYRLVSEAMERSVCAGKSPGLFEQAFTALQEGDNDRSYLSRLPADVLERKVIPWVVRRGCEAIPPRRRRLASLKSLLELSTRYLEEMQADDAYPAGVSDEAAAILTNLLDPELNNNEQDATDVSNVTSERIGLGILADRVLNDDEWAENADPTGHLNEVDLYGELAGHLTTPQTVESPRPPPPTPHRFFLDSTWIYPLDHVLLDGPDAPTTFISSDNFQHNQADFSLDDNAIGLTFPADGMSVWSVGSTPQEQNGEGFVLL